MPDFFAALALPFTQASINDDVFAACLHEQTCERHRHHVVFVRREDVLPEGTRHKSECAAAIDQNIACINQMDFDVAKLNHNIEPLVKHLFKRESLRGAWIFEKAE